MLSLNIIMFCYVSYTKHIVINYDYSSCVYQMVMELRYRYDENLMFLRFLANVNSRSRSLYVIDGPSVCRLSVVCLSSVTFVRPTKAIEIFGNISTPSGTLAIHDICVKILRRSSQGNPCVGGVKHKRGSRI